MSINKIQARGIFLSIGGKQYYQSVIGGGINVIKIR